MSPPKVVDVTPSPISPRQWVLTFSCGHRTTVTSARKPPAGRYCCGDCWWAAREAQERAAEVAGS